MNALTTFDPATTALLVIDIQNTYIEPKANPRDAAPGTIIPATVSFVADVAQFTPKTVETASEREKLMFRVKAKINPELLLKHKTKVKTGLPGVAYLRLDSSQPWPDVVPELVQ